MSIFGYSVLFILGTALGSFLNVVVFRYDPDRHVMKNVHGRSHCMHCNKRLSWYELIPILSFLIQFGRCRSCGAKLSFQYPLVEILSGAMFVLAAYFLVPVGRMAEIPYPRLSIWLLAILALILISVIDFRLRIIPDELNVFIAVLAAANLFALFVEGGFGAIKEGLYNSPFGAHAAVTGSFLGPSGMLLWPIDNLWLNFIFGAAFGGVFFGAIYYLSRGRAMGFGDVKFAFAAGLLLGFPDMVVATMIAFITGELFGLFLIAIRRKKSMKDSLPFGPFIALGIITTVFFGYDLV